MATYRDSDLTYWAAKSDLDLAEEVYSRVKSFYQEMPRTVQWRRWLAGWAVYNGRPTLESPFDITEMGKAGQEGELATLRTGDLASLARHIVNLIIQSRPSLDPVATNEDYESLVQTRVARGVLEYLVDHEGINDDFVQAVIWAVACGEGWIGAQWDPNYGQVFATEPDTGVNLRDGRVFSSVTAPWDMILDFHRKDTKHQWQIVRSRVNKFDLMAQYPGQAEDIYSCRDEVDNWIQKPQSSERASLHNDFIPVYTLFHQDTPACPGGKWAVVLNDSLVLAQGPLPYEDLPFVQVTAGTLLGTANGDSPVLHGIGIQKALDHVTSAQTTNNINLATQTIAVPRDAAFSPSEVAEGMSWIECDVGPDGRLIEPKAIQLTASSPESWKYTEMLSAKLNMVTGVNSLVAGNDPSVSQLSGSAMLVLENQVLRYTSSLQLSYSRMVEQIGTRLVQILKRYAKSPKLAKIAGKAQTFMLKSFTGADFEGFDRVEVQQGSAGMRTPAFRAQMASDLIQHQLITTPEEYMEVLSTGNLDTVTEARDIALFNVKRENEMLMIGQKPTALMTDGHQEHILEHRSVLDNPEARDVMDPNAVKVQQATLAHIQEHLSMWKEADPAFLAATKQQPLPPPPPPPGMGPPPGPPGTHPAPGPSAPGAPPGGPAPQSAGGPAPILAKPPLMPSSGGQRAPLPPGSSGRA